jgi:pyroglutamyl-peptidase
MTFRDLEPVGLVTGFEPFAGMTVNPSSLVLPDLYGTVSGGIRVETAVLPVSLSRGPEALVGLVDAHRPRFVMMMGLASGAPSVRVETMALNVAAFRVADNDGLEVADRPLEEGGPAARRATWDAAAVVAEIEADGVPVRQSFHAGTHLCNAVLYAALGRLESEAAPVPCGFLHLPYLPEQILWMKGRPGAAAASWDQSSMPLEMQRRAARAAISALSRMAPPPSA